MDPIVNEVAKNYKGQVDFVYIDTETFSGNKKADEEGVMGVPMVVFFASDGERVQALVGTQSRIKLEKVLDDLLGK